MLYSVYSYPKQAYDYYQAHDAGRKTHAGTPPRARGSTAVGSTPEQSAWPLPLGAKLVGSGPTPKGRIASMGDVSSSSLTSFVSDNLTMLVVGGVLAWHFWGKK
jgi:hypothetical protein